MSLDACLERAVEQTFEYCRYKLTPGQTRTLCLAWAVIALLNSTFREQLPAALDWEYLKKIGAGEEHYLLALMAAMSFDSRAENLDTGLVAHIGLARTAEDFARLTEIWSALPPATGGEDILGMVYMAALHR
jgi:hypothetical protein